MPKYKIGVTEAGDSDWHALVERMNLTPEFQEQHHEGIIRFLCNNGANIAMAYQCGLNTSQKEAYFRVVKAELMGKPDELKYYEGDLQRELDSPLTVRVKTNWPVNLHMERGGLEVRECDDFFSTMLLGVQPQRTCLAYADGAYKTCLLSAFDSNKKILYAALDGRVVGRAFLRLTKGKLTGADAPADSEADKFTFVDLEDVGASRPERTREKEELTLFLERPYIADVGPVEVQNIMTAPGRPMGGQGLLWFAGGRGPPACGTRRGRIHLLWHLYPPLPGNFVYVKEAL